MENWYDEQEQSKPAFDVRTLLKEVWRRKWLFIIPFVICLSMAVLAIKTMSPMYYSSGQLEVRADMYRSQLLNDPTSNLGGRRSFDRELLYEMDNLLTSPTFLEGIVRELGLQKSIMAQSVVEDGPPLDEDEAVAKAIKNLNRRLRIYEDGHRLYRIGVRDPDPQQAFDLAQIILDRFLEEYRKVRTAPRASTRNFLLKQKDMYEADLEAAETELNEFMVQLSSSGLAGNPINTTNLATVDDRLTRTRERLNGMDANELVELESQARPVLGALPATDIYTKDAVIATLRRSLIDLGVQELTDPQTGDDLARERGRQRVQLNSRIEEMVTLRHPTLNVLDRNRLSQYVYFALYTGIERQVVDQVAEQVRRYRAFVAEQPRQSTRLTELQDRVAHMNDLVMTIEREITQQRMNLEAGMSDVGLQITVREQPAYNPIPVEPNKMRLAMLGFFLSAAMGGGLLLLAMLMDKSFKTVDAIERALGYPVLGTLPQVKQTNLEKKRQLRLLFWFTIVLAILAVGAFGFLVLYPRLSM